jgi:hypothetical protein
MKKFLVILISVTLILLSCVVPAKGFKDSVDRQKSSSSQ